MTAQERADVHAWLRRSPGITASEVLRIFDGGRILTSIEVDDLSVLSAADLQAIETERAGWYLDGETWRRAPAPDPDPDTECKIKGCGGNIVDRIWPDRIDRGCHKCGRALTEAMNDF